jgi:hypothetical protein
MPGHWHSRKGTAWALTRSSVRQPAASTATTKPQVARYAADMSLPGTLWGKFLHSPTGLPLSPRKRSGGGCALAAAMANHRGTLQSARNLVRLLIPRCRGVGVQAGLVCTRLRGSGSGAVGFCHQCAAHKATRRAALTPGEAQCMMMEAKARCIVSRLATDCFRKRGKVTRGVRPARSSRPKPSRFCCGPVAVCRHPRVRHSLRSGAALRPSRR